MSDENATYSWGDAEKDEEGFQRVEQYIKQVMVHFNIRMKDLVPECQQELKNFLVEHDDLRYLTANNSEDYIIARVHTLYDGEKKSQ